MRDRKDVVLSCRFKIPERLLIAPRVILFEDRLRFSGWSISGRYELDVALRDVVEVDWFTTAKGQPNLRIVKGDGREHFVWIPQAALWCYELRRLAGVGSDAATIPASRKKVANAA